MNHKHVTTEIRDMGWMGRVDCVCCGYTSIGNDSAMIVATKHRKHEVAIGEQCVEAIVDTVAQLRETA